MFSIAFFNNKGGVGKTTLICNLAAYLSLKLGKKILVVDADPQCNATQLMLSENRVLDIYENKSSFTIHSIIHPLAIGKGYAGEIEPITIRDFGVDLVPGDPRLALKEDLLSTDWQSAISGDIRGLRTTFVFAEFLKKCSDYDLVLFDVGPSLGSINRAVLLACDFFLSPMSIDIFSVKAIENISVAIMEWKSRLETGLKHADKEMMEDIPKVNNFDIKFLGYVAQQYKQKTTRGEKRAVDAYEKIMKQIPRTIERSFVKKFDQDRVEVEYRIGSIPNLHSLVPMSQSARKPIFELKASDGVRGGHFNRVQEASEIFGLVADNLQFNIEHLSDVD